MSAENQDTVDSITAPMATETGATIPDRTAEQTPAAAAGTPAGETSKNAAKKAAKQAKMAADKAAKAAGKSEKPVGKSEAKQPTSKATNKKKASGTDEKDITVSKEEDFPGWYQQVLTKGDMLDYYDVSGCYILKAGLVQEHGRLRQSLTRDTACFILHLGSSTGMVQSENQEARCQELLVPSLCV